LARDLDVFAEQTLPPMLAHLHAHAGLIQLNEKATQARLQAYVEVRAALASQRYQRLLLAFGAWLENERWRQADSVEYSVLEVARTMLAKRHKQLRKHGRRLMHMQPEERHATRIAAKKLRYSAEFFASLYPKAKSENFLRALENLLDIFGVLNDIAVTEHLVDRLIGGHPDRALDESLLLFAGWNGCHAMHRMQDMERSWSRFARQKPFWDGKKRTVKRTAAALFSEK
jgi:CHAD domain-containing protein